MFLFTGYVSGQQDTIAISGVEIRAGQAVSVWDAGMRMVDVITRAEIAALPVTDVNDLLKYAVNADVRKRGVGDAQADLSLRGGSFEQVLILLNGISMNDPQTGHHQLDIPVALGDIERVEVLEGSGSRVFGPNAFSGVINIVTGYSTGPAVHTALSYGSFGTYSGTMASTFFSGPVEQYISITGSGSDGYRSNTDYGIAKVYYRGSLMLGKGSLSMAAGWMSKEFGANGFYSPKYPDQFEATKTKLASVDLQYGNRFQVRAKVAWRRHHDRFELFRNDAPLWYSGHNYHMTDVLDAGGDLSYTGRAGVSTLGAGYSYQHIFSNVLGEPFNDTLTVKGEPNGYFNRSKLRENIRIYIGHDYSYKRFSLSAGCLLHYSGAFGLGYYPGIDISYRPLSSVRIVASVNRSLRLPTFTELYYKGPVNIGNSNLKPEESWTAETGLKYSGKIFSANTAVFYRYGYKLIDWIQVEGSGIWHTENLTNISAAGIEASADFNLKNLAGEKLPVEMIRVSYAYLDMHKKSENYISYYVMDYLRHHVNFTADVRLFSKLTMVAGMRYYAREGSYVEYPEGTTRTWRPVFMADAGLRWVLKETELRLDCGNLFNKKYEEYANIPMPGISVMAGVICRIGLTK